MEIGKFKKFVTLITITSLLTVIIALPIITLDTTPKSVKSIPRMKSYPWMSLSQWFIFHAEDVALAEQGEGKILFLGDSIIQNWSETKLWEQHFKPLKTLNFGIGGDMTQNLLWRLEHGATGNLKPEKVILMIGTNNLSSTEDTPKEIYRGVAAVVHKLKNVFPKAKILLMGIFPREERYRHPHRATIKQVNQHLQSLGKLDSITYLDIGEEFLLPDKTISQELMPDFLHPAEKGYEIWMEYIFQWINSVE